VPKIKETDMVFSIGWMKSLVDARELNPSIVSDKEGNINILILNIRNFESIVLVHIRNINVQYYSSNNRYMNKVWIL